MVVTATQIVDRLAALEHEQWVEWSKAVAPEVSEARRSRWRALWVPYDLLPEEEKEKDREWARRVLGVAYPGSLADLARLLESVLRGCDLYPVGYEGDRTVFRCEKCWKETWYAVPPAYQPMCSWDRRQLRELVELLKKCATEAGPALPEQAFPGGVPHKGTGCPYRDADGRVFFVSDGISRGRTWAVYTRKANGALRRCRSRALPPCSSPAAAQAYLDVWAERRGLERLEPVEGGREEA